MEPRSIEAIEADIAATRERLEELRGELARARQQRVWDTYPRYRGTSGRELCVVEVGASRGKVISSPGHHAWSFTVADGKSVLWDYFALVGFDAAEAEKCRTRIAALRAAGIVHE